MGLAAIAAMMLATSCANEDLKDPNAGTPGTYTFDVKIEQSLGTRAYSDGKGATQLLYQVYTAKENTAVGAQGEASLSNLGGSVEVTGLTPGTDYKIVFWAQNPDNNGAFVTSNLLAIQVNYSTNNNELMDAFYGSTEFNGNGGNGSVSLRRPFAQINVGVPTTNAETYTNPTVTISGGALCNTFNAMTGVASGTVQDQTFSATSIPATETLTVNNTTYNYVSMTYILVNGESLVDYTLTVNEGEELYTSDNLTVQNNYRTNILGKEVVPGQYEFAVTVVPQYDGNNNEYFDGEEALSVSDVQSSYDAATNTLTLTATYSPEDYDFDEAGFILTPVTEDGEPSMLLTRVGESEEDGVITIEATKGDGPTLNASTNKVVPGTTYNISVYFDDQLVISHEENGSEPAVIPPAEEPDSYIYIVGVGQGLGWDLPGMPVQLSNDVYTVTIQDLESFKFSSVEASANDWSAFNSGAYLTNDTFTSNVSNTGGQTLSLRSVTEQDGENNINTPWKGTYTVTISADFQTITLFTETPEPAGDPASIWVVGEGTLNGNTTLSFTLPGEEVSGTTTNITFTLSNCIKFKFSTNQSTEWDNAGNFNDGALAPTAGFTTAVYPDGQLLNLEQNSSDIILPEGADFTITVNLTAKTMLVKASQAVTLNTPSMYIRGASFGWNAGDCTSVNELKAIEYNATTGAGTWKIENVTIDAGAEFKIADNAWGNLNYSSGTSVSNFSDPVTLNYNGNNMSLSQNFTGSIIVTVPKLKEQATAVFTVQ